MEREGYGLNLDDFAHRIFLTQRFNPVTFVSASWLRTLVLVVLFVLPARVGLGQDRVREARSVSSFVEVEYAIPGTLHLRQGQERSVEVEAPQQVLSKVETRVDGSTLEIQNEGRSNLWERLFDDSDLEADEIDVYVSAPTLQKVTLAGSGRVVGETPIRQEALSLSVAGSGDMEFDVEAEDLDLRIAGSGDCTLRGTAAAMTGEIAGSGDLRAVDLETQRGNLRIAGSGDAEVHVTDHLSAQIFGSGDVHYRGQPTVETSTVGSGEVGPID